MTTTTAKLTPLAVQMALAVRVRQVITLMALATIVILATASGAAAHAELTSTTPGDGSTVEPPVPIVTVRFSEAVTPIADGFEVLTPSGRLEAPVARSIDRIVWVLELTAPQEAGLVTVRFEVSAEGDGHVRTGGFSFTIGGPPTSSSHLGEGRLTPEERSTEFLDEIDDDRGPEAAADIGRRFSFVALLVAIGLITLAVKADVDRPEEVRLLFIVSALLGGAMLLGSALEIYGLVRTIDGDVIAAFGRSELASPLVRLVAGALLISTGSLPMKPGGGPRPRLMLLSIAGPALGVVSLGLDGHTVSEGPRVLHAVVNAVHVTAAGIWLGGLVGLALVMRQRFGNGMPAAAGSLFIRFSTAATTSLAAVVVAGVAMAVFILDEWGDLFATPWGRRLLVKVGLVACVLLIGGYNQIRILPLLRRHPDNQDLLERAQLTVMVEAGLLLIVAAVAASMAAASSS